MKKKKDQADQELLQTLHNLLGHSQTLAQNLALALECFKLQYRKCIQLIRYGRSSSWLETKRMCDSYIRRTIDGVFLTSNSLRVLQVVFESKDRSEEFLAEINPKKSRKSPHRA